MKALVLDDDLTTRLILQEILSRYAGVNSYVDGNEAMPASGRALQRGDPHDLIRMDVLTPVMGGIEAPKGIRSEPRARKVIISAAAGDKDTIHRASRELCDAYVVEPIDAGEIIDIMHCLFPLEEQSV